MMMNGLAGSSAKQKNSADMFAPVVVEEKDPYAPSDANTFLAHQSGRDFRSSVMDRSRLSSFSTSRRGSMGMRSSVASSTGFDR